MAKQWNPGDLGEHNLGLYQTGNPADNPWGIPYGLQLWMQAGNDPADYPYQADQMEPFADPIADLIGGGTPPGEVFAQPQAAVDAPAAPAVPSMQPPAQTESVPPMAALPEPVQTPALPAWAGGIPEPAAQDPLDFLGQPEPMAQPSSRLQERLVSLDAPPAASPATPEPQAEPVARTQPWGADAGGRGMQPQEPNIVSVPQFSGNTYGSPTGGGITYDEFDIPEIGGITLPDTPMMSPTFDLGFQDYWRGLMGQTGRDIGAAYNFDTPSMTAAQLNLGDIPQVTAQTPESNRALEFLLSGQGYGDDALGAMRAQTIDDISRGAAGQRSSAKLAAQRAGLQDSGAGLAMEAGINRRADADRVRALQNIDIEDAGRGLENQRIGAGMELGRSTSAAQMANNAALANAAQLFAGMQQNVANVQQASGVNTANQQQQQMGRAGAQAGAAGAMGQQMGSASIDRYNMAEGQNVANQINRGLNQAQLDRQRDMFNVGTGEQRYGQGMNLLGNLISGTNPYGYDVGGAAQGQNPNLIGAQSLTNLGGGLLNLMPRRTTA